MKKYLTLAIFLIFSATCLYAQVTVASYQEEKTESEELSFNSKKISGSFEANYLRHYLWRGITFGNDDVAQPELTLSYKDFSLVLSQNFNYRPSKVPKEYYTRNAFFDEQDVEITYSKSWGKFTCDFSAMAYFYFYQIGSPNTAELYNNTGYNFLGDFTLFTENSVDIVSYPGAIYSNNGIQFERGFRKGWTSTMNAYAGFGNIKFNDVYFGTTTGGLNLVGANLNVTKDVGKYYFSIEGEKNFYTNKPIRTITGLNGTDNFSLAIGVNF